MHSLTHLLTNSLIHEHFYIQTLTHSLTHSHLCLSSTLAYPVYSISDSIVTIYSSISVPYSPLPHPIPCFPISSTSPVAISPAQSPLLELSLWVWVINQTRTLFTNSTQALPSFHPVSNIIGAWNKRSLQLHQHSDKSECACWQQHS